MAQGWRPGACRDRQSRVASSGLRPRPGSAGPNCPVQPERDVRVKRAQHGQITWGRVELDAEVPADHEVRAIYKQRAATA